jgi:hypothetical protein
MLELQQAISLLQVDLIDRAVELEADAGYRAECHVCLLAMPDVRRNREGMCEPGHTRAK